MTLPLGKNIRVTVGSKSAIRVCVIDNGSDTAYTFDEKGVHHIGEQYQLPPTPLNIWRSSPRALTGGNDYLPIGSVNFTYWLSPIANKEKTHFDFAKLQKGNLLTIYERSGNNQVREKTTIDLLYGAFPRIQDDITGGLDDKFYGNVQLFKLADNDYYMPGARLADFGSQLPSGNFVPLTAARSTYTRLNTTPGNITTTVLLASTSPTGGTVICPNSVTHLGTFEGAEYFSQSNTGNPVNLSVGPMIGLLRANSLSSYGGRIVLATAQTFRIMSLTGNTATQRALTGPSGGSGSFTSEITDQTPGVSGGFEASAEGIYNPPLLGNIAPLYASNLTPTSITRLGNQTAFCMMRIGDRYVLHQTTFPTQASLSASTAVADEAPTFTPIAELPSGTYDAMYCNVSRYASNGPGIDCSLFVTDTSQTQSTNVRRQSALSGIASQTTSLPSDTYIRGTLRGFRLDRIELPMSMTQGDTIYDIVSIDPVSNQVANILFQRRDI